MFRRKFRAEPALALTALYAALSLTARANVPRQDDLRWPPSQPDRAGLLFGQDAWHQKVESPRHDLAALAEDDAQLVRSVQLTGVTQYAAGVFDPYLRYLMHRPLAMSAVETVVQAISIHYRADGHVLPRISASMDDNSVGKLVIAVFEA